jgi:hypothetical protein
MRARTLTSAFVAYSTRRMSSGTANKGVTFAKARRQAATTVGNVASQARLEA